MRQISLVLALVAGILTGCNSQNKVTVNGEAVKLEDGIYAKISTDKGDILGELHYERVPMTVGNFVALAEGSMKNNAKAEGEPFYDGLKFHRVIADFMIQGGDPSGNGSGGPGYKFPDEIHPELKHDTAGIFSMANSGPGTNGSQFFITHKETPWLDGKHTVFGKVVKGQDVVNAIAQNDVMNKVEIIRVGKAAKDFDALGAFNSVQEEQKKEAERREADKQKMLEGLKANSQKTASGLYYQIIEEGTGPQAKAGDKVAVHYKGTFLDDVQFDNSYERGQPIEFTLGQRQVIPGWDEGIALMKVGSKFKLIIPPSLGYGQQPRGPIPANSWLIFNTELVEIKE